MANNITLNPGSGGPVVSTEDISGVHFPNTKLVIGAASANDGPVSATNPMPVVPTTSTALATNAVSVASTATLIVAQNTSRKGLVIRNSTGTDVMLGTSGVTVPTGFCLGGGETLQFSSGVVPTAAVYGIVSVGTATVTYMEW